MLAKTDSMQIAIPCYAGTGAKEARDDRIFWQISIPYFAAELIVGRN